MKLGEIYPEIGFITQAALANGGVEITNTGSEPLVLTFDFLKTRIPKHPVWPLRIRVGSQRLDRVEQG